MTVRMRLAAYDNLDAAAGRDTEVGDDGQTAVVSLNGWVRQLDLTKAHYDELCAVLQPYLDAGDEPGAGPVMEPAPVPGPLRGQGRRREIPGTRELYQDLRDWAAANGIVIKMAGRAPKKNYVYEGPGITLKQDYVNHLAKLAAAGGEEGHAALARLAMTRLLGFPEPGA
jgi:hypothetical protein